MKFSFFCNYFLIFKEHSPIYPLVQSSLIKVVWSGGKPSYEGEEYCKVQVSWLCLESRVCNVQQMALMNELATLLYIRGKKFGKRARRHNQNFSN